MAPSRAARVLRLAAGLAVLSWIAAGVRVVDRRTQFVVVTSRVLASTRVLSGRSLVFVPPLVSRASYFPVDATDVPLPQAREAMLPAADGSRFGLKGTARVRALPSRGADLAAASGGDGLPGVVLSAVRAAAAVFEGADRESRTVSTRTTAFDRRLQDELGARGAVLEGLELNGFDDLTAREVTEPIPSDVKVLVVGLDGADWKIADP